MPELRKRSFGSGDPAWLGSAHGIRNSRSSVLDISTFTAATHFPDGFIPSGTPVNCADEGAVVPWADAEDAVLGFVLFDHATDGSEDLNVAVFRHGIVKVAQLPVDFTIPANGDRAGFVFIEGSDA